MKVIKKFKKSEKGAITVFVLTALLLMLVVLGVSYMNIANKGTNQNKKIQQIAKQYQVTDDDMEQKYNEMFTKTTNTVAEDSYGNKIVIPEGFKVRIDDTTNYADTVNEGIVIEDVKGNQFVWIPVGDIKTDSTGTTVNITLGRYDFAEDGTPSAYSGSFTEDTEESHNSSYENAIAKNITDFVNSTNSNHGYYIGRYEAGVTNYDTANIVASNDNSEISWTGYHKVSGEEELELVCKYGEQPWNYVTQNKASELARNMYTKNAFESDLVNSYAWDTAIVFIQTCGIKTNSKAYSREIGKSTDTNKSALTGAGVLDSTKATDEQCNIYDMAGNEFEWTTETTNISSYSPCVRRGGRCGDDGGYTSLRYYNNTTNANFGHSFRPLLYIN